MERSAPSCPTATPGGKPVLPEGPDWSSWLRVTGSPVTVGRHWWASGTLARPADGPGRKSATPRRLVLDRLCRALNLDESAAGEVHDLLVAVESAIDTDSEPAGLPAGLVVDDAVRGARSVRSFQCVVLPALLQSAEYARHVFESAPDSTPETVGRAVAARVERQSV